MPQFTGFNDSKLAQHKNKNAKKFSNKCSAIDVA